MMLAWTPISKSGCILRFWVDMCFGGMPFKSLQQVALTMGKQCSREGPGPGGLGGPSQGVEGINKDVVSNS